MLGFKDYAGLQQGVEVFGLGDPPDGDEAQALIWFFGRRGKYGGVDALADDDAFLRVYPHALFGRGEYQISPGDSNLE